MNNTLRLVQMTQLLLPAGIASSESAIMETIGKLIAHFPNETREICISSAVEEIQRRQSGLKTA